MNKNTIKKLIDLNQQFYQTFGKHFSDTRQRLQPGVHRIVEEIPKTVKILDLGCGNGELFSHLIDIGYQGQYIGLDFSKELIRIAQQKNSTFQKKAEFIQGDITSLDKISYLNDQVFDFVFAFSVLHHIPGKSTRHSLLKTIHSNLSKKGKFIHSEWQFLNSERLSERIQVWNKINLTQDSVDEGDYLLDWRRGGLGFRYVHLFNEEELSSLAEECGFFIQESFYSDGENGKLGLYQIWSRES